MKKLISLLLCLLMVGSFLVSCAEETIGDEPVDYVPPYVPELTIHLYVIGGDSADKAINTVESQISQYTYGLYKTKLDIHYLSESNYNTELDTAIANGDQVDIVLVNNKAMYDTYRAADRFVNLTEYFNSKTYGILNAQISANLLYASRETTYRENGTVESSYSYVVPNNRVIGEYEYLVINKAKALEYKFDELTLSQYTTYEQTADLRAAIGADADQYVFVENGMYEDKAAFEAAGYVCNVITYPQVSKEDAYASAFAIMKSTADPERAMQIVYALNTDTYLRNLFQYGVESINYTLDDDGHVVRKGEENLYDMDLMYTGDLFKANYCKELGYTEEVKTNGEAQNSESQVAEE